MNNEELKLTMNDHNEFLREMDKVNDYAGRSIEFIKLINTHVVHNMFSDHDCYFIQLYYEILDISDLVFELIKNSKSVIK